MIRLAVKLYLTAHTVSAERARAALRDLERRMTATHGVGSITTEIIDVLECPERAAHDQVFATPTLIRTAPGPVLRLFGDLSSADRIIESLSLKTASPAPGVPLAESA